MPGADKSPTSSTWIGHGWQYQTKWPLTCPACSRRIFRQGLVTSAVKHVDGIAPHPGNRQPVHWDCASEHKTFVTEVHFPQGDSNA